MATILTKAQRVIFFEKLGKYAAKVLREEKDSGRLQYKEIAEISGLQASRVSEIVNNELITESQFIGLLRGGVMSVGSTLGAVDLTEQEKRFLQEYAIHEDGKSLGMAIIKLKRLGGDPLDTILEKIKKLER